MLIKSMTIPLLLTTITLFTACSIDLQNKTPKCSNAAVVDTLSKILSTDSRKATIDVETIRKKLDLTEQNGKRTCRTRVDYTYGIDEMIENYQVIYTVILSETGKHIVSVIEE